MAEIGNILTLIRLTIFCYPINSFIVGNWANEFAPTGLLKPAQAKPALHLLRCYNKDKEITKARYRGVINKRKYVNSLTTEYKKMTIDTETRHVTKAGQD